VSEASVAAARQAGFQLAHNPGGDRGGVVIDGEPSKAVLS
jgi:hypothetical protein